MFIIELTTVLEVANFRFLTNFRSLTLPFIINFSDTFNIKLTGFIFLTTPLMIMMITQSCK